MGRVALSSLYRREIESRVNDAICETAYYNIGLMGVAGPGDDRKKSPFSGLQQGKGALRHQGIVPNPRRIDLFGAARYFLFPRRVRS